MHAITSRCTRYKKLYFVSVHITYSNALYEFPAIRLAAAVKFATIKNTITGRKSWANSRWPKLTCLDSNVPYQNTRLNNNVVKKDNSTDHSFM